MDKWKSALRYDPVPRLMSSKSSAIKLFSERDLLNRDEDARSLWVLPEVEKITRRQREDGSWLYPNAAAYRERPYENYTCLETYRNLGLLVEEYGMDFEHHSVCKAVDYLLGLQTVDGDIRGIYGNQYSPNYTAGILELITKAGYGKHPAVKNGFEWLLSMRQNDGGWALPLRTAGGKLDRAVLQSPPLAPDRSKPFSHLITGVVLRALAAHPDFRGSDDARKGAALLKSRFFQPDSYTDRSNPSYWTRVSFPFWFTDIVSSLDSVSSIGFSSEDTDIKKALEWLALSQCPDGSWALKLLRNGQEEIDRWIALAICRIFKRLYQ